MIEDIQSYKELRSLMFGGRGDEIRFEQFPLALLAVGFAVNYPDSWQEALETWPEGKPLPWGPKLDSEIQQWPQERPLPYWSHELSGSPREAIALMDRFVARRRGTGRVVVNVNPDYLSYIISIPPYYVYASIILRLISEIAELTFLYNYPEIWLSKSIKSFDQDDEIGAIDLDSFPSSDDTIAFSTPDFYLELPMAPVSRPMRFLRCQVVLPHSSSKSKSDALDYFHPGIEHELSIWIAPLGPEEKADGPAFPEDRLQPGAQGSDLTVVLVEPDQLAEPLVGALLLPKDGPSDTCVFMVPPLKPGGFDGTLIVLHRNRVIQTAALFGSVVRPGSRLEQQPITFKIDAVVRQDLADLEFRDPFDAAFLLGANETRTVVTPGSIYVREMGDVTGPAAIIRETLDAATRLPEPNTDDLLYTCAHQGVVLRAAILDGAPAPLATARTIQLVSAKPEAYLPLEFCYDGEAPDDGAEVCTGMGDGCRTQCTKAGTAGVICPLAFWGLSRVIERHSFDSREAVESGWQLRPETSSANRSFGILRAAVVGASTKADSHAGAIKTTDIVETLKANHIRSAYVNGWAEWRSRVGDMARENAALLLVIGHTEQDARARVGVLEIGGEGLKLSKLDRSYIGTGNALAVVLGCDTLGEGADVDRFVSAFRRNGAAVVIGTTTAVLGQHAVPLAKALVDGLGTSANGSDDRTLGELMRDLRRGFLQHGIPIGLATVAFGDADWRFERVN